LNPSEIEAIVAAATSEGVDKVKLTGGEPLLYSTAAGGVVELVARLSSLRPGHRVDLSMTTNGVLLGRYAAALRTAGLDRVTMSLTTIDRTTFTSLIGPNAGLLRQAITGLEAARRVGLDPIKMNVPLYLSARRRLGNVSELADLVDFAILHGVAELRLFTLLWHENFQDFTDYYQFFSAEVCTAVRRILVRWEVPDPCAVVAALATLGTAFAGVAYPKVEFGVDLGPVNLVFEAMQHDRLDSRTGLQEGPYAIRVAADGAVRPTLYSRPDYSLVNAVRKGADQHELRALFRGLREDLP
jgi:molybdenum cofactor biosynthesis enzyme MoaA